MEKFGDTNVGTGSADCFWPRGGLLLDYHSVKAPYKIRDPKKLDSERKLMKRIKI